MTPEWADLFIALLAFFGGGGLVVLLTVRQQRRRIAAGASVDEASAASTMSEIQMRWVVEARDEARAAHEDAAAARRETAEVRGRMVEVSEQAYAREEALRRENRDLSAKVTILERHVERLVRLVAAAGLDLPAELDPRRGGHLGGPRGSEG